MVKIIGQNIFETKKKILDYISANGPSLPVRLTGVSGLSLTITSAVLSELFRERKLKFSNLKVGSSSLYYLPGQEEKLENFISNLASPEIEAFKKLKENKILDDEKQTPVMRVALRAIRDFAIPLKKKDKLFWKYHLLSDEKAVEAIGGDSGAVVGQERVLGQKIWEDIQKEKGEESDINEVVKKQLEAVVKQMNEKIEELSSKITSVGEDNLDTGGDLEESPDLGESVLSDEEGEQEPDLKSKGVEVIFDSSDSSPKEENVITKKLPAKKPKKVSKKDLLFEEISRFLEGKGFSDLVPLKLDINKIIVHSEGVLIIVYDKKRIEEAELLRDVKRYGGGDKKVKIFLRAEAPKKITEKISLFNSIQEISKIEEQ